MNGERGWIINSPTVNDLFAHIHPRENERENEHRTRSTEMKFMIRFTREWDDEPAIGGFWMRDLDDVHSLRLYLGRLTLSVEFTPEKKAEDFDEMSPRSKETFYYGRGG